MSVLEQARQNAQDREAAAKLADIDKRVEMEGLAKLAADKAQADTLAQVAYEARKFGGMNPNVTNQFTVPSKPVDAYGYIANGGAMPTQDEIDTYMRARQATYPNMYTRE